MQYLVDLPQYYQSYWDVIVDSSQVMTRMTDKDGKLYITSVDSATPFSIPLAPHVYGARGGAGINMIYDPPTHSMCVF